MAHENHYRVIVEFHNMPQYHGVTVPETMVEPVSPDFLIDRNASLDEDASKPCVPRIVLKRTA